MLVASAFRRGARALLLRNIAAFSNHSYVAPAPDRRLARYRDQALRCNVVDPKDVFVNQELNLESIQWVGFDYDYTLCDYKSDVLNKLIYDLAKSHLISARQYPESIGELVYDKSFAVRGVAYDTKRGCIMKLDFLHAIQQGNAFFGRRQLSEAEIRKMYGSFIVTKDELTNFRPMVDLFCLSEACLISDVIQHFVDKGISFDPSYVYNDVRAAVSHLHGSGILHSAISADQTSYIEESTKILQVLRGFKESGKKLFLLTNSGWAFINAGMRFILRNDLPKSEEWMDLFDVIIVNADKPSWYDEKRPFRSLNSQTGKIRWVPVEEIQKSRIYHGGSLAELNKLTGGDFDGSQVLYLGDHVFSDLSKPNRAGWRTGAIIHELEREVTLQLSLEYRALQEELQATENLLRNEQDKKVLGGGASWRLKEALHERERVRGELKTMFNQNFGSEFRTHAGPTLFMQSILRYSDIYTSSVENLLSLSPEHHLYPYRRRLPHEPALFPYF